MASFIVTPHEGLIIGYQSTKHRQLGLMGSDIEESLFKVNMGDRIDLENRFLDINIPWSNVAGVDLVENFSCALYNLS